MGETAPAAPPAPPAPVLDPAHRGRALLAAAAEVEAGRTRFVDRVRRAHRCGITEAVTQVDGCIDAVVRWAGWADKLDLLLPAAARRPPPVAVLAPEDFLPTARVLCAALAAGARCVVVHDSAAVAALVEVLAAEFPAGAVARTDRDPGTVRGLLGGVALLDARAARTGYDADLRLACAEAGVRALPPLPEEELLALGDLDLVAGLLTGATRTV